MCALTLLPLDDFSGRVTYILSMIKIFLRRGRWAFGGGGGGVGGKLLTLKYPR